MHQDAHAHAGPGAVHAHVDAGTGAVKETDSSHQPPAPDKQVPKPSGSHTFGKALGEQQCLWEAIKSSNVIQAHQYANVLPDFLFTQKRSSLCYIQIDKSPLNHGELSLEQT